VSSVLLSMNVFAVRHRANSPWRACASFVRCVCPVVAGLLECVRVLASLFKEWPPWSKAMRRLLALPKHFPHKSGQAVRNALDAFCPIGVVSVIRGCLLPLSRDWRPPPRIPYKSRIIRVMRGCLLSPKENFSREEQLVCHAYSHNPLGES
jgi:hypothetical protein